MFLRQARAPRLPVRSGRLFKVGREGIQGKGTAVLSAREGEIPDTSKLSHVARRRIAQPPMAKIEKAVTAVGEALQAWADRFIDAVMARTVPGLLRSDDQAELIEDATVDQVYASLSEPPDVAKATLESVFSAVDKASSDDLRVVGVRTGSVVSNAERLQAEWIRESTDLIKASQDVRRRVERILADPLTSGRSVDDIRKLLEEQAGYARSRAELTARDQTLKLYGRIQQERQTSAGFTHYVWTTSLDERVREGHAELEGTIQAWDDPPIVDPRTGRRGNPGSDFQCRCSAVPFTGDADSAQGEDDFELTATLPVDPRVEVPTFTPPPPFIPTVPASLEPLSGAQMLERAQLLEVSKRGSRQAVEAAAQSAVRGRSLADLKAIPFTEADLRTDKALEFLRADPFFRTTGNVADNLGSSPGGLPQITVEADGKAYLSNGRHRVTVARELGLRQIIARVRGIGPRGGVLWEYIGPIRV